MQAGKQIKQQRTHPRRPFRIDCRRKAKHRQPEENNGYANRHLHNPGAHWNGRFPHPLHTASEHKEEVEQDEKHRKKSQKKGCISDRFPSGKHQPRQRLRKEK